MNNNIINFKFALRTFEELKHIIIVRLVPTYPSCNNPDSLVVPLPYAGRISVQYYIDLIDFCYGNDNAVPVTKSLFQSWGITMEELHTCAMQNTEQRRIAATSHIAYNADLTGIIVTDETWHYGAVQILLPEAQKYIYDNMGNDYYVVPATAHGMICFPTSYFSKEQLLKSSIEIKESMEIQEPFVNDVFIVRKGELISLFPRF